MVIDINQIAAHCVAQKKTLTPQRLRILKNISECIKPITAYDLKSRLDANGPQLNISTIYRVLEFWIQLGVIHKVDSNKTYIICQNQHSNGLHVIQHCVSCDGIAENADLTNHMDSFINPYFAPMIDQVIELKGECKRCLDAKKSPK